LLNGAPVGNSEYVGNQHFRDEVVGSVIDHQSVVEDSSGEDIGFKEILLLIIISGTRHLRCLCVTCTKSNFNISSLNFIPELDRWAEESRRWNTSKFRLVLELRVDAGAALGNVANGSGRSFNQNVIDGCK
jgi:hypothetical protein